MEEIDKVLEVAKIIIEAGSRKDCYLADKEVKALGKIVGTVKNDIIPVQLAYFIKKYPQSFALFSIEAQLSVFYLGHRIKFP